MSDDVFNEPAEVSVIGCLLFDAKCLHTFELAVEEFYLPGTRWAYEAVVALVLERNEPADILTVADEVRRQGHAEPTLETLGEWAARVPTAANVVHYAKIVRQYASKRRLLAETARARSEAVACDPADVVEVAERMQARLAATTDVRQRIGDMPVSMGMAFASLEEGKQGEAILPTGLAALDGLIGGLPVGALTIIAGRPSMGKSSLSRIIADNVATRGEPVGYVTLEEDGRQFGLNLVLRRALVDSEHVMKRTLSSAERDRLNAARLDLQKIPLFWTDDRPLSAEQASARLRRMKAQFGIKLAIVDYWNRIALPGRRSARDEGQDVVTRFAALAGELRVPLVVVAQLNRENEREQRKPRLSDLKETGGWEEAASLVVLCHREGFYKDSEPQDEIDLIVAKSKLTRTGRRRACWCGKYLWVGDQKPRDPDAREQRRMLPYGDTN